MNEKVKKILIVALLTLTVVFAVSLIAQSRSIYKTIEDWRKIPPENRTLPNGRVLLHWPEDIKFPQEQTAPGWKGEVKIYSEAQQKFPGATHKVDTESLESLRPGEKIEVRDGIEYVAGPTQIVHGTPMPPLEYDPLYDPVLVKERLASQKKTSAPSK